MRILIVEDEHRIAASIKKGLELEHFVVDIAYDGADGFDLAVTGEYDCLVLDIMLPGLNGIDICKRLRQQDNHTPILILTARGQLRDKVTAFDCGVDDYLTKPFNFEELLVRIRALTRRPHSITSSTISLGGLILNPSTFEVSRDGQRISLSAREFSLLEYFLRHPNQILTKDQIINHVWDYNAHVLPNTVEVYVKNLRRKIDFPFTGKKPLLVTVRGFGYKIEGK